MWPIPALKKSKFWPSVGRVDDGERSDARHEKNVADRMAASGDLNLICECGTVEEYA